MEMLVKLAKAIPGARSCYHFFRRLAELYRADRENPQHFLNGHFYSPIPSLKELVHDQERIFNRPSAILEHIHLHESHQVELLQSFVPFYEELPFPKTRVPEFRFCYENNSFPPCDAVFLYSMIRHLKPRRWIEIGCGYSSALTLDVNDRFLEGKMQCSLIDPYPQLAQSLLRPEDFTKHTLVEQRVQDVELEFFQQLESGDVLFVDSSHVSKAGSDLNHILFEILPTLNQGVWIHFHDIFYPFEYPKDWLIPSTYPKYRWGSCAWNEIYLLKAFLAYNSAFRIELMQSFLLDRDKQWFKETMPLCLERASGSLWLRKVT